MAFGAQAVADPPPGRTARSIVVGLAPGVAISVALLAIVASLFAAIIAAAPDSAATAFDVGGIGHILWITAVQAGLSTLCSITLGLLIAWSLSHRREFPGRRILIDLLAISMVLPTLVAVLGLVSVLGRNGWLNAAFDALWDGGIGGAIYGLGGIVIAHTYLNGPFAARTLLHQLEVIPGERFKVARSLGMTPWQRFRLVEWPALAPALPGLAGLIFLLCFTSFAVVLVLGGSPKFNTLEVAIYEAVKLDFDLVRAVGLALVQLAVCGALVLLAAGARLEDQSATPLPRSDIWSDPIRTVYLQAVLIAAFVLFFLGPLISVVADGLRADFGAIAGQASFRRALLTSLVIATASSLLTLVLALNLAGAKRFLASPLRAPQTPLTWLLGWLISFCGAIYLALPALVMGLGFFLVARRVGADLSLVAPWVLLSANVLLALPFAMVILTPAMEKASRKYDRQAFALGVRGWSRWRIVEWPLLRSEIAFVGAISFCLSFGDLGVIALFGNRDFATLPWLLYQKMGSYRTDDAAGIALILLGLTVLVFFALPRLLGRRTAERELHADA